MNFSLARQRYYANIVGLIGFAPICLGAAIHIAQAEYAAPSPPDKHLWNLFVIFIIVIMGIVGPIAAVHEIKKRPPD